MKKFVRDVWSLSAPYWKSQEKGMAWLLLAVIVAMNLADVYLNVQFSQWNRGFYNSLQDVNEAAFYSSLKLFCFLALLYIVNGVYKQYLNQMLRNRWRRWLTGEYLHHWLSGQTYYRMQLSGQGTDNPDQRISEDVSQFIELTLGLTLGLLNAGVTLFSFLGLLWMSSGPMAFDIAGMHINVPAYMVWVALLYSIVGTWLTSKLGRPLIGLNFNQQRYEADFRFSMARLRENTEGVAFYGGEDREKENFISKFTDVFNNYWEIMKRQKKLTWFTSGYGQIAIIFPYLVTAPRFFAKQIKLGDMTQTATYFGQVQGSLSFFVDAYTSIATWKAVVERLSGFTQRMRETVAQTQAEENFRPGRAGDVLSLKDLAVKLPAGQVLLKDITAVVAPGQSLLVKGPSGCGKSTLLRALAGIWPYAAGQADVPEKARLLFLPQKPYLPIATLRAVLSYPEAPVTDDARILGVLADCGLQHLEGMLDTEENWSQILSLGEQQRVGFARAILTARECLFLDEATSALDTESESHLYGLLRQKLPQAILVSVGHRETLDAWHDKTMTLGKAMPAGASA